MALAVPPFREGLPLDALVWLKTVLLVPQDPEAVGGTGAPVLIVAWSLHYELVFYAVFATFILSRRFGVALLALFLAWWSGTALDWGGPTFPLQFMKPYFLLIFSFGVLSGWLATRHRDEGSQMRGGGELRPGKWFMVGTVLYFACAGFEVGEMFVHQLAASPGRLAGVSLLYGIASAFLVTGMVLAERCKPRPVPRILLRMGDASYVLYLAHFPIISACAKVFTQLGQGAESSLSWVTVSVVSTFVICCTFALVLHWFIEAPLLERLSRRNTTTTPTRAEK